MYLQRGTCIYSEAHVLTARYMYLQRGTCIYLPRNEGDRKPVEKAISMCSCQNKEPSFTLMQSIIVHVLIWIVREDTEQKKVEF
jgi:hypothetical protein